MRKTILLSVCTLLFLSFPGPSFAATYKIDTDHTEITFKVKHLGISYVSGSFGEFQGTFEFDPNNVDASRTEAKIAAKSINTRNKKRDDHLRAPDFLDASKFPAITFVSKEIKNVNGSNFTVVGDLSIHGVTKEVELAVTFNGAVKDPWGNEKAAFSASTEINRKHFGLTWNKLLETGAFVVGEEVKISIEVEGTKQ